MLCVHSHRAVCLLDRDGIPPYRIRKQHRREMQESVQVNGRGSLPHIPVSPPGIALPPHQRGRGSAALLDRTRPFALPHLATVALGSGKDTWLGSCGFRSHPGTGRGRTRSHPAGWRGPHGWLEGPACTVPSEEQGVPGAARARQSSPLLLSEVLLLEVGGRL